MFANLMFRAMVERESESIVGRKFAEFLSRGSAIFYETQFAPSLLLRGTLSEIALDIATPSGSRVPVLLNASFETTHDGATPRIHISVFIAKQRKLYEAELLRARKEFEELAEIVRRSSDGIIRFSASGIIESWNNGARQIFGYSFSGIAGQSLHSLFPAEDGSKIDDTLQELRKGVETSREAMALRQDGTLVDVSISLTPHMEAPGTLVGFSAIIRDTTVRKKAEKALLQSEKLASVGRLASSIAHEINNPLESVTNLLYILSLRVEDEETRQFVVKAQEELARVSHIATHTLRFHKQSSSRTEVNLRGLAETVLALYRARLESSNVSVTSKCKHDCRMVCFEGELRQILVNLVANAYDALRLGGKLSIRTHESRDWRTGAKGVRILIADNGTGMAAEVQAHLFEPFISTKGIGGTGLGLWITKDLVANNNGSIVVRSSARAGHSGTVVNLFFSN